MNELFGNIKTAWEQRSAKERTLFAVAAAGVVVLALVLILWTMRTNYEVLFSELDTRDAAAIVEELKRAKVPYKIADGGTKILVEEKLVHETRLRLMGRGVALNGGVGFEIFDNKDVGMTEYTQKINYQRALQGELARTIMAINQVKQARVHLVVSESTLFKRQKVKPKASVSLVLKPGSTLNNEQIVGIQRLVAASVPGLEPGAVTVVDQAGVTLSAAIDGDEDYALASGKLKLKKNAEDYFVRKVTGVLDRTFGPGQAIVSVDVTLNFDEVKRTQQTVVPLRAGATGDDVGAVVRKRQSVYRQAKTQIAKAAVDGEPTYAAASPDLTSTTDVEYELGKSVEQVVSTPGGIRRLSVGVIAPSMTPAQTERLQDVIGMVVGYSAARGDAISVRSIDEVLPAATREASEAASPSKPATETAPRGWLVKLLNNPWAWAVAAAAFVLIVVAIVSGVVRSILRRQQARAALLNEEQRRARLSEIKAWIDAERVRGAV